MKKAISTIVAIGLVSGMLANTAYAGNRNDGGINPLWIPVAILSTLAAVTIAQPQPVVYERRITYEPRHTVIYEEPRHWREHNYEHRQVVYHDEHNRSYEEPRNHYR
ncbi:MAG: hypothetical protein WCP20_16520 [Desulfuromonadales bacterium]